jgi:uncharacterized lipoprotein
MRLPGCRTAPVLLALALAACGGADAAGPSAASRSQAAAAVAATVPGGVRLSELHYDNAGTDTGEAIEITAPAGTDLTGWSVAL